MFQQGLQVQSNIELQHAEGLAKISEMLVDAYDKLGYQGFKNLFDKIEPALSTIDFNGSRSDVYFNNFLADELSKRYNLDMDSLNKELQYDLGKEFSAKQIRTSLEVAEYNIAEIVGRLNSMRISNDALIDRTAAECVRAMADAFKLRKEGDKYEADAKTANALRNALVRIASGRVKVAEFEGASASAKHKNMQGAFDYLASPDAQGWSKQAAQIDMEERGGRLIRAMDKVFGEYFNVNYSYGHSYGSFDTRSYGEHSNVTPYIAPPSIVGF